MSNFVRLAAVVGLGVVALPGTASAQFAGSAGFRQGGYNYRFNHPFQPLVSPFLPPAQYAYQTAGFQRYQFNIPGPAGNVSFGFSRAYSYNYTYSGYGNPFRNNYVVPYTPAYMTSGYMTGGSVSNPAIDNNQRNFEAAQRQAAMMRNQLADPKTAIYDQWAYEKLGVVGLTGLGKEQPEALQKAIAGTSEAAITSGEALNHILTAAVALEGKGASGVSAFLAPNLLADIRFGGSAKADAVNVIRSAGKLDIPTPFDTDPLRVHAAALERDFAAVTAPVLLGKSADPQKLLAFEATLKKAEAAAGPLVRTLPFADAIAVRRFLNQLDAAAKSLKDPTAAGVVNPKWATEGANVADLVKHMTKFKLMFGASGVGNEEAYLALHKGLSAYLFVLGQGVKK